MIELDCRRSEDATAIERVIERAYEMTKDPILKATNLGIWKESRTDDTIMGMFNSQLNRFYRERSPPSTDEQI